VLNAHNPNKFSFYGPTIELLGGRGWWPIAEKNERNGTYRAFFFFHMAVNLSFNNFSIKHFSYMLFLKTI
jgi:hypothetical protein